MVNLKLGVYGGTFNPPHKGHISAAAAAAAGLALDKLYIVPSGIPPHKQLPTGSPTGIQRLEMAERSFRSIGVAEVSDMELVRGGVSYTVQTLRRLAADHPDAELWLIVGTDMFVMLDAWKNVTELLELARVAVFTRRGGERDAIRTAAAGFKDRFGMDAVLVEHDATDISSSQLRRLLPGRGGASFIEDETYAYIIQNRLYGAKPDFNWLRQKAYEMLKPSRIAHVAACEEEAVRLARRWGADVGEAREAAILHDITKRQGMDDQLQLCREYDIMTDAVESVEVKLLHAKTGAALARGLFGASQQVHDAIFWHTTGRPDMTLLEKIIYMADYIESTRRFDGVEELRSLAYSDLDQAIITGLSMSIEDLRSRGIVPHQYTEQARDWLLEHKPRYKRGSQQ